MTRHPPYGHSASYMKNSATNNAINCRESQVDELAMELLLLLVILPAVQDQNHTRDWLKHLIRAWCKVAGYILDLRSYLFGDVPLDHPNNPDEQDGLEDIEIAQEAENILNNNHHIQNGVVPAEANEMQRQENDALNDLQHPVNRNINEQAIDDARHVQPDIAQPPAQQIPAAVGAGGGGLGAVHQALLLREGPTGFQPYNRPSIFALRVGQIVQH